MERPPQLLGTWEAAAHLGVARSAISRYRRIGVVLPSGLRVRFPEPVAELRMGPVWVLEDIERLRARMAEPPGDLPPV